MRFSLCISILLLWHLSGQAQTQQPTKQSPPKTSTSASKGSKSGGIIDRHKIPKVVMSGFIRHFPNQFRDAQWKKEGANYMATFGETSPKSSIVLNANGKMIKSRGPIDKKDLPEKIQSYTNNKLFGFRIGSALKMVDSDEKVTYEVTYKSQDKQQKIVFDRKGNPVVQGTTTAKAPAK